MTSHKATLEQWALIQDCADDFSPESCILELRARVEALEAKSETQCLAILDWGKDVEAIKCWNEQQVRRVMALEADAKANQRETFPTLDRALRNSDKLDRLIAQDRDDAPAPTDSLVERVADAIHRNGDGDDFHEEARAAIREVAAWMTGNPDVHFPPALVFALEREAE
jgi:hypothetical protein